MNQAVDDLLKAALLLTDEEQLQLVTALSSAIEEKGLRPFDDSWLDEIRQRSDAYDVGSVQPIPWEEVKQRIRKRKQEKGD